MDKNAGLTAIQHSVFLFIFALPSAKANTLLVKDYQRTERMLPWNIQTLTYNANPSVFWLDDGSGFWYQQQTHKGIQYYHYNIKSAKTRPAFDHHKLAAALQKLTGTPYDATRLTFPNLRLPAPDIMDFKPTSQERKQQYIRCYLNKTTCTRTVQEGVTSPDGRWTVRVKTDHNLYIKDNNSGKERALTHDASPSKIYATWMPAADVMVAQGKEDVLREWEEINWAPDSSRFVTYRLNMEKAHTLTLVQAVHNQGMRPKTYTYPYALPGDTDLTYAETLIFEIQDFKRIDVNAPPIPMRYDDDGVHYRWSKDSKHITYIEFSRGNDKAWLREINALNGESRIAYTATSGAFVTPDTCLIQYINNDRKFILSSERDGWHHLYLHDAKTGEILQQITKGEFYVRGIAGFDEKTRQLYFTANGREPEGDIYFQRLYRIGLDGSGLTLLTTEPADHNITLSTDFRYFIDKFSTAEQPTKTVLRDTRDGNIIHSILNADISKLKATGWQAPEPFTALAEDGKTVIHGIIYRPSQFDPKKSYPIIENIYAGPGRFNVPKSFDRAYRNTSQSIAELGFIVVIIDARGTGMRHSSFHHIVRHKLGGFLGDHVAAIKQLANQYSYIDLERVGIFGFSAGGYDSARAIFLYPDFYKVAVSASGNHDHRLDKADWNEKWMGYPVGPQYQAQSNLEIAHQLQGKLLLVVGELDHNVPPAASLQLLDRLIKANKDFEFFIMPNKQHYLETDPYFIRRRWDFFVRHLLGATPPPYQVGSQH